MPEDSLKKRYFFKLSTNLISLIINFATQAIIPRGLGPKAYGDFNFLTSFFNEISAFFDMGTSTCFYTKLSQRPKEFGLVLFYSYIVGVVSLGIIVFVIFSSLTSIHSGLWPGQKLLYIYLAAGWGILIWIVQVLCKMADAYGLTIPMEKIRILQKFLGLIFIFLLFVFHQLHLKQFFFYHYLILLFLIAALVWTIVKSEFSFKKIGELPKNQFKMYFKEFYAYSHPLFSYAIVGLLVGIFDRWLLQYYGGSIQQGFYGLSYQIGALCFLFTSAMTPLLTREFSIAFGNNDVTQMALLFRRYIPMLYSIAAYFSCFIAMQADKVIYIFGGSKYKEASIAVAIMAFFPIHQTYGQLSGSVFYATGQTSLYRNIGVTSMLIGLPVTYFLIAPGDKWGINAGATGLAIKMVLLQFIAINVQLYFNSKYLKFSFKRYLGHQIFSVGCLLTVAFLATIGVDRVLGFREAIIPSFLLAGFFYTIMVIGLFYCLPIIFGLKRQDIEWIRYRIKKIRIKD